MTPITVDPNQLIEWGVTGYIFLHVLFGLTTHYHSVWQVRKFNIEKDKKRQRDGAKIPRDRRVSASKMVILFAARMTFGFPWFIVARALSPTVNRWHMTPDDIRDL